MRGENEGCTEERYRNIKMIINFHENGILPDDDKKARDRATSN